MTVVPAGALICHYRGDIGERRHELDSPEQGAPDPVRAGLRLPARIADYQLVRYIGQGSMATVYLAEDQRWDRQVALKLLVPELARDETFRAKMMRESRAAAAVGHPNILPVYEAGQDDQQLFAATRYVRGGDARSMLNRLGPLPFGYAWLVIAQVAAALDAAHAAGLIHRDVKPANILLEADVPAGASPPDRGDDGVESGHAYLADFGMSRAFSPDQAIATGQLVGTLDYVAPEQIEGVDIDGRTDQYSLACTGFELLCGAPPFGQDQGLTLMYAQLYAPPPAASARRDLPEAVDRVLGTALAKRSADRYPSCGAFADELRAALGLRSVDLAEPGPHEPGRSALPGPARAPGSWPAIRARAAAGSVLAAAEAPTLEQPAVADPATRAEPVAQADRATAPAPAAAPGPIAAPAAMPDTSPARPSPATEWPANRPDPLGLFRPAPAPAAARAEEDAGTAGFGLASARDDAGDDTGPRRSRVLKPVLIGTAVVIAAGAIASGVALSSQPARQPVAASSPATSAPPTSAAPSSASASPTVSASSTPAANASQQAAALGTVLTSSAAARTTLNNAVGQVVACTNLSGAVSELQDVVAQRSSEYGRASGLTTSALPGGSTVKSELMAALSTSLTADKDFLSWAQQQRASGCTPSSQSSAYSAAYSASQTADAAKQSFVDVWNPVAHKYGIRQDSAEMI
jgi:serine/threonine protein kinase